jgi:hypothetical protein
MGRECGIFDPLFLGPGRIVNQDSTSYNTQKLDEEGFM